MNNIVEEKINGYKVAKEVLKRYVCKYRFLMMLSILFMIIAALSTSANAYLIQPMLDHIFIDHNINFMRILVAIVILVSIIKGISEYFENYLMKKMGQNIITDMQMDLYSHLIYSDLSLINSYSTGKLISRFTIDINTMKMAVSTVITGIFKGCFSLAFLIGVMFYQNFFLSSIAFLLFPVTIYPILRLGRTRRKIAQKTQEDLGNYTMRLDETFKNVRIIKSYNQEQFEISRAEKIIGDILKLYIKAAKAESLASPIIECISGIAIALVIWYGGHQVINGVTTAGSFFSFITAMIMAYKPIKHIASLNNNLQEGIAAARRFFSLLEIQSHIVDKENAVEINSIDKDMILKDVCFSYPEGKQVLDNFSLTIPSGKTVAFVGGSGAGKSTILNILLRFYDIDSGKILINDIDISDIKIKSLREAISIVTQEVAIFDDTIYNNIAYAKENASYDEVLEAARLALVDDFVSTLPEGYETLIGQSGIKLSGGQRQRIALARAILKNSDVLIMDEATSSLDNITEESIMRNIKNMRAGKTNIIVAHRLSTIIEADIIYVMHQGKVVEFGTHEELISLDGYYRRLYLKSEKI